MPHVLAHFAIEADDVARAKAFYQAAFGWTLEAWGPPDFYMIRGAGVHGALQQRQPPRRTDDDTLVKGMELTFAVTDLAAAADDIRAAAGRILGESFVIPGVGELLRFADTEGNQAVIMQYEPARRAELGI